MLIRSVVAAFAVIVAAPALPAQSFTAPDEIPIERCDRLPVVRVRIGSAEMRFLVDTGATSTLNLKSFNTGRVKLLPIRRSGFDEFSTR
jgi:hypothetical protein